MTNFESDSEDIVVDDLTGGGINTGIGIVVPASRIYETLFQPELTVARKAADEESRKQASAVADES